MMSSRTRRWLFSTTVFIAACACTKHSPQIPPAQAEPALPANAKPAAEKASATSGDDNAPPPGVDLGKLDEFERKVFYRVVNREPSACGKGHSLIYSLQHDKACRASFYAVRYVALLVDSGFTDSEIGEKLEKRFRAPRVPHFDVATAPSKGAASGRVTVVEFVDYECPHCKHAQTLMRQLVEEFPNDLKVYFKHYPLSSHTNARLAAEGAVAAHKQGKFWPFNEKIWAISDSLTPAGMEKAAKEAGLDVKRWRLDLDAEDVKARVDKDKSEGNALGINSTPSIYINGRKYNDPLDIASLRDWIDEELGR
jgi:predicted DsbA family dithiol-disulfide isomerase